MQLFDINEKRLPAFLYSSALSVGSWLLKYEQLDGVLIFNIQNLGIQHFRLVVVFVNDGRVQELHSFWKCLAFQRLSIQKVAVFFLKKLSYQECEINW